MFERSCVMCQFYSCGVLGIGVLVLESEFWSVGFGIGKKVLVLEYFGV